MRDAIANRNLLVTGALNFDGITPGVSDIFLKCTFYGPTLTEKRMAGA